MKAAIHTQYGPPEVVSVQEVSQPVPKDNEVLVKVHASTVNRTDCGFRSAEYFVSRFFSGLFKPNNPTLGNEFAGVVAAVGKSVETFKIGDKVFGYNDKQFGAHAEYMTTPAQEAIATIPENISFETAAAISEGAHYALCDIRAAKVQPGQNVLVNGATGAIGSAAVQLLKHFGARVTVVCNTPNIALVQSLGADVVVDYTQQDFTHTNEKFDFVFDAVGKSAFTRCKKILKPKGIYISTELGKNGVNIPLALVTPLLGGKKLLFPIPTISQDDILFLEELVATGQFKPVLDKQYTLDQIVEAYRYVGTGQKVGNVIISMR